VRFGQRACDTKAVRAIEDQLYVQGTTQRCSATYLIDAARGLQFACFDLELSLL